MAFDTQWDVMTQVSGVRHVVTLSVKQRFIYLVIEGPLLSRPSTVVAVKLPGRAALVTQCLMYCRIPDDMPWIVYGNTVKTLRAEIVLPPIMHRAQVEGQSWLGAISEGASCLPRYAHRIGDVDVRNAAPCPLVMHGTHALAGNGSLATLDRADTASLGLT